MHASILLLSALGASVFAAPVAPDAGLAARMPDGIESLSEYFNMLAARTQDVKLMDRAPVCDLSKATLPPSALAGPSPGLKLAHVAIGRGTQNYTCAGLAPTAAPGSAGAVATLFNASCVVATYPALAKEITKVAIKFNLSSTDKWTKLAPSTLAISGLHYFTGPTTPFFNLDVSPKKIGQAACSKKDAVAAPADAAKGQLGEPAVAWLKLTANDGSTGNLKEVYRVETVGGSAPATCEGMPATFQRQYVAEYWFFQS
ncbi:hypothetical protein B0H66DRAFT_599489 [Apodospora peruviana]|uniref:Malate dehydrogenase n=1 Tax=Apodospora peruviana TaxID=516989 RepID=A0AAE0MAF8_9PEZI|nr:hypothetical protein B0H66DRAFT_599489 [Apodospora peruviana]